MRQWAAGAVVLALLVAACGDDDGDDAGTTTTTASAPGSSTPSTAPTDTTRPAATTSEVLVYLLRGGRVAPAGRAVRQTPAVARAALDALFEGPTAADEGTGLTSSVPPDAQLHDVTIAGGTATVRFTAAVPEVTAELPRPALAQIVYTATQFPTVQRVVIARSAPMTRADFEDVTPPVLLERPVPGATVSSPLRITGTANVFEATFQVQVLDGDSHVLVDRTITATAGTGTRGTFDATLEFTAPNGDGKIVVFTESANDGSRRDVVEIPVRLASAG